MEKPNLNEYWHVRYGLNNKESIIVKVIEDKELNPPNWYHNSFLCEYEGKEVVVYGGAFIEKMDKNW